MPPGCLPGRWREYVSLRPGNASETPPEELEKVCGSGSLGITAQTWPQIKRLNKDRYNTESVGDTLPLALQTGPIGYSTRLKTQVFAVLHRTQAVLRSVADTGTTVNTEDRDWTVHQRQKNSKCVQSWNFCLLFTNEKDTLSLLTQSHNPGLHSVGELKMRNHVKKPWHGVLSVCCWCEQRGSGRSRRHTRVLHGSIFGDLHPPGTTPAFP